MASKNLMDTLTEVYEPQWTGQDLLTVQGQNSEMLWADLAHKLSDQVSKNQNYFHCLRNHTQHSGPETHNTGTYKDFNF